MTRFEGIAGDGVVWSCCDGGTYTCGLALLRVAACGESTASERASRKHGLAGPGARDGAASSDEVRSSRGTRVSLMLARPTLVLLSTLITPSAGHGALISPPSRNAVDRFLPAFHRGATPADSNSCNCGNNTGCDAGIRASGGGQPCLWFSQGCSIGCSTCTGIGSHANVSLCNATTTPTLPKHAWTMNRWAVEGSVNDTYRHSPWRRPGSAPVVDACGQAGGTEPWHAGPGVAVYANNSFARFGDHGSKVLPPAPSGTVWEVGTSVEVSWGIRFNHGGGYSYRLCPASEPLTEACFAKLPLDFNKAKGQSLMFNNGTRLPIKGTYVDSKAWGSKGVWAMNPIPRIDFDASSSGQPSGWHGCKLDKKGDPVGKGCIQFSPPCPWDDGWYAQPGGKAHNIDVEGACSGDWTGGVIVDEVLIPKDLPVGEYVLGWRWDCEESTQVWSNCADVTIVAPRRGDSGLVEAA